MTLAACLHTLLLRTTYTACYCSLPSRHNITVITFCKHLRLQFYCTPLLPVPPLSLQGNFVAVAVELCNCANCSVHKLKKSKCTAATRDTTRRTTNLAKDTHTDIRMYTCTYIRARIHLHYRSYRQIKQRT